MIWTLYTSKLVARRQPIAPKFDWLPNGASNVAWWTFAFLALAVIALDLMNLYELVW